MAPNPQALILALSEAITARDLLIEELEAEVKSLKRELDEADAKHARLSQNLGNPFSGVGNPD